MITSNQQQTQSSLFGTTVQEFVPVTYTDEQIAWAQLMVQKGFPSNTVEMLLKSHWRFQEILLDAQPGNLETVLREAIEQEERATAKYGYVKVLIYGNTKPLNGQVIADVMSVEGIKMQNSDGSVVDATEGWRQLQTKFNEKAVGQLSASIVLDESNLDTLEEARGDKAAVSGYFLPDGVVTLGLVHRQFNQDFAPELRGKPMYRDAEGNFTADEEGNTPVQVVRMALTGRFQSLAPSKNDVSASFQQLLAAIDDTAHLKQRGMAGSRRRRAAMREADAGAAPTIE
jgi:hypothetical protein